MATTPNYGWVTPAPTDLVTDLPADFETFADAVDADLAGLLGGTTGQVLKKTSNSDHAFAFGVDPTFDLVTTAGDLVYGTAADTMARLGIGTANQVLTVNAGATAPEWKTAGATADSYTLINAGGTALTGATTITVSGISAKNSLFIFVAGARSVNATTVSLRFNSDTGSNYNVSLTKFDLGSGSFETVNGAQTSLALSSSAQQTNLHWAGILMHGCNSTEVKPFSTQGAADRTGTTGNPSITNFGLGQYSGASTISSVSIISSSGNFNAGTIYVYGA
jgi:hypothetical protein